MVGSRSTQPMDERFSVIICAYTEDRWDWMVEAIHSIQAQTVRAHEIILAIDHNSALLARTREQFPEVMVVENREQRGLSGARNSGMAAASGSILVFMDEDAMAAPDWLERLQEGYADPCVMGVGGAIQPLWVAQRPGWFPDEFAWVVGCTYRGMPETAAPVRNLIGANMSFRRVVYERAGGFTNGMGRVGLRPVGCEETEFCIRAAQMIPDWHFLFDPRAKVRHRVPAARSGWNYFFNRCYSEGLSKAQVARRVGAQQGLSNERSYTFRTLPQGVFAGIGSALRGDLNGLGRAAAITAGLLTTTVGYVRGTIAEKLPRQS